MQMKQWSKKNKKNNNKKDVAREEKTNKMCVNVV